MNDEILTIHDVDLNMIYKYYSNTERQGPGSPEIDTIPNKVAQMQKAGYLPIATFVVPETCWTDYYYAQVPQMEEAFLKKYNGNESAEELISSERYEVELYRKYKAYYGYVFYIGKRIK